MTRIADELLIAKGGLQIPSGAVSGYVATSDASGNISWNQKVPTGAMLYWADFQGNLCRAHRDASSKDFAMVLGCNGPYAMEVGTDSAGNGYLVWAEQGAGAIGRCKLDGSGFAHNLITGCSSPTDVTTDGTYIYWVNEGTGATIGRAKIDGSSVNQSFITVTATAYGITCDANFIYWANFATGKIGRATLAGGSVNNAFIDTGWGASHLTSVTVDGTYIFATKYGSGAGAGSIGRGNLDGSGWNGAFLATTVQPFKIKTDGVTYIYWSNHNGDSHEALCRAGRDGTGANQSFIDLSAHSISGMALGTGALT